MGFIMKITKRIRIKKLFMSVIRYFCLMQFILLGCLNLPAAFGAEYEYIDITNPFLKKIPIAVPVFKTTVGSEIEGVASQKSSDLLYQSLEFTGYFRLIPRDAYLEAPQTGIIGPNIKFRNWTAVGAELLITGGLLIKDDIIELELRLFDTFKERLLIGKKYKGVVADQRKMIRRFCSEVVFLLTGNKGIFNSRIAFVSSGTGNKEIYICEFDGYQPEQITHNNSINLSPAWSSDGKWIAYTSYAKGNPDLYIKHLTENRGTVISRKGYNISPAWVPGRFELTASLSFSGDPEIYLLTGNGKMIKKLTNSWGIDVSPAWSPDGRKMAFVSDRSGTKQIYINDLATDQVTRLTFQGRENTEPNWSPMGDRIAFSAAEHSNIDICTINSDGSGLIQLTYNSGRNESPSWSPDGSMMAFSSTREGGPSRIYVMTAYGTDQRRLLSLSGQQSQPGWSPLDMTN